MATPMAKTAPIYAWLDLEMTGLDPKTCHIVELALILTDTNLERIAPPLELVVWQPPSVLETMSPFVRELHTKTGLLNKVQRSEISVQDAEHEALKLLSAHAPFKTARLCGNSIHADRAFLVQHMPSLSNYLHYRHIDVSTLKELGEVWNNYRFRKPQDGQHTALFDIEQSIAELKDYRENLWRQP